ncbi:MAG: carbon-nitrogen hydrolase family protein [Massilia sp.]|nr:carbon-nitrogen hydrolase family protein [Massilia sp.]
MAGLRIAAAQSKSVAGDVTANVGRHCAFIDVAATVGTQLLVFPELSLTGYDLRGLANNAIAIDDARLDPLRERAARFGMTIVAGAPLANKAGLPFIGALIFHADGRTCAYRKHFLHDGEESAATARTAISKIIDVRGVPVALAICADTAQRQHPHAAAVAGATLYVAGSVITPNGYEKEAAMLSGYAKLFQLGILLANHAFDTGGVACAGRSAFWLPGGQLLIEATGQGELLVLADEDSGAILPVDTSNCH